MIKIIILVFVMSFVSCSLLQRDGDGSGGGRRGVASLGETNIDMRLKCSVEHSVYNNEKRASVVFSKSEIPIHVARSDSYYEGDFQDRDNDFFLSITAEYAEGANPLMLITGNLRSPYGTISLPDVFVYPISLYRQNQSCQYDDVYIGLTANSKIKIDPANKVVKTSLEQSAHVSCEIIELSIDRQKCSPI